MLGMLGANAVRKRREKEKREKVARGLDDVQVFPFIKPFGSRFDRNELPYFKYRETLRLAQQVQEGGGDEAGPWEVGCRSSQTNHSQTQ